MRILIIEDEKQLVALLTRALVGEGHVVESTYDGEIGLEKAASRYYEVILLDLRLPKKNRVRRVSGTPRSRGNHTNHCDKRSKC